MAGGGEGAWGQEPKHHREQKLKEQCTSRDECEVQNRERGS